MNMIIRLLQRLLLVQIPPFRAMTVCASSEFPKQSTRDNQWLVGSFLGPVGSPERMKGNIMKGTEEAPSWSLMQQKLKAVKPEDLEKVLDEAITNLTGEKHRCTVINLNFQGEATEVTIAIRGLRR